MNPAIFRPNDIRGVVGVDFDTSDFILIGQGYAKFLLDRGANQVVLGRDNRLHSPGLASAMIEGLISSGIDVIDIGEVTTPMVYFARQHLNVDGGVCITASHNPPEWNGAKLCHGDGAIHEEEITEVANNARLKLFEKGRGTLTQQDIVPAYFAMLREKADFKKIKSKLKGLRVAVDSGNGMAGRFVPKLLKELGFAVTELYSESDGTYPNHLPDPVLGGNIKELWFTCKEKKLDLGFAYDGDVDRLNAIDGQQVVLWGDGLNTFFARELLSRVKEAEILFDVMSSPGVPEDIRRHGGNPIIVPTGHAIINHQLHKLNAPMAGEYSGHLYFSDGYLGFDDAIYATFRLLNILSGNGKTLSDYMHDAPNYVSSGITNITVPEEKKAAITKLVQDKLSPDYYIEKTSGVRIKIDETWGTVHPSGTESLFRVVAWGKTKAEADKTRDFLVKVVNQAL